MRDVNLKGQAAKRPAKSTLRLGLRHDGLDWIAGDRPDWRHPNGDLIVARVAEAAGLHRQSLSRVVTDPGHYPKNETIAAIARLGATTRECTYGVAIDRIFQMVDIASGQARVSAA